MEILVCVKQVPDTAEVKIDPVKHTVIRAGVPNIFNPFDQNALEAALQMKDADKDVKITLLSMGPDQAKDVLDTARSVDDHADAFAELDYNIFRGLAFASGNPIYGLILNGMKGLYTRIGRHYFSSPEARKLALGFYHRLADMCKEGLVDQVYDVVRAYGRDSGDIWHRMHKTLPGDLAMHSR